MTAGSVYAVTPDWIDVTTYGAVPNDANDDTVAIQDAIDALSGPGTVYFPVGSYRISSPLTVTTDGTTLLGSPGLCIQSPVLDCSGITSGYALLVNANACSVKGLYIDGAGNTVADGGIYLYGMKHSTTINCRVANFLKSQAIGIKSEHFNVKIADTLITAITNGTCVSLVGSSGGVSTTTTLSKCYIRGADTCLYAAAQAQDVVVNETIFESSRVALYNACGVVYLNNPYFENLSYGGQSSAIYTTPNSYAVDSPVYTYNGWTFINNAWFSYVAGVVPEVDKRWFRLDSTGFSGYAGALLQLNQCTFTARYVNAIVERGSRNHILLNGSRGPSLAEARPYKNGLFIDAPHGVTWDLTDKTGLLMKGKLHTAFTAAPVDGTWEQGDVVYNTAPTATGPIGWKCTAGGTPGTWVSFGGQAATQSDSTGTYVTIADFNALLAKLKAAGLMAQ